MRPIAVRSIGRAQLDTDWDYARDAGAGAGQHHQRTDRRNQRAVGGAQALDRGTVFHAPCSMLLQRCHRVVATWAPGRVAGDARRRQRRFD
ncbi:MAG TPA: hypothetical protein VKF35_10010 [Hyphomicrobiaceae bacterium]|nr:hypothetical protein [Hyphomicrobiaceae bacterium]